MDDLLLPRRRSLLTALAILGAVILLLQRISPDRGALPFSLRADIRVTGPEAFLPGTSPAREPSGEVAGYRVFNFGFGPARPAAPAAPPP